MIGYFLVGVVVGVLALAIGAPAWVAIVLAFVAGVSVEAMRGA